MLLQSLIMKFKRIIFLRMKYILAISSLFFFLISCKKTINCTDPYIDLAFISIPATNIDTIILRKYALDNNFSTLLDTIVLIENMNSSIIYLNSTRDTAIIRPVHPELKIISGFDWQIFIPSTQQTFAITNIKTQNRTLDCATFNTNCYCYNDIIRIWLDNKDIMPTAFKSNTIFIR